MFDGDAWPRVCHADGKVAVHGFGCHPHFALVCKLDGVAYEVEEHLRQPLLVPQPDWQRLGHLSLEGEIFVLRERLGGRTHRLNYALDSVFTHVQGELARLDLGDVEHGVYEPEEVLAIGANTGERVEGLL